MGGFLIVLFCWLLARRHNVEFLDEEDIVPIWQLVRTPKSME
jgi:hypothetical protein